MKIALLHYSAPPVVGGVESVIDHHAALMAGDGHQVQVIAGRGRQVDSRIPFVSIPLIDSRQAAILSMKEELDRGNVPVHFESTVGRIEALLLDALQNTDILIAHNVCSLNKNLPLTAALFNIQKKKGKLRMILWHHDLAWTTSRYASELHEGYPWNLLKTAWDNVKQVTISDMRQDELSDLMKIEKSAVTVVENGVDVTRLFKLEEQTQGFVRETNLLDANPLLLLPVRITPRKNIELALRTLAHLRKQYANARLVVTGPLGPHNPANVTYFEKLLSLRLELGISAAAHFLAELTDEYIPDAVISDFYQLADMLFLPSLEEGFGIPILEAGLAAMPIFCSDIPPLRKLGGDHAVFFSPDENPEKVSSMIVENIKESAVLSMKAHVRSNYTWERVYRMKIAPMLGEG